MSEEDRNLNSYIMNKHQRCAEGNRKMFYYMFDWYRFPKDFESGLWLSQIQQGLAVKYAVEHWRRNMPRCMGSLYWQLNDCWPVASWSSIDSFGRWKALQYMARRFYAPLLISGVEDGEAGSVGIHITSDRLEKESCDVRWIVTNVSGNILHEGTADVVAEANGNTHAKTLDVNNPLRKYSLRDLLVWLELWKCGERINTNFVTFCRPRDFELKKPEIESTVKQAGDGLFEVKLAADKPALWVWLELAEIDAHYSDNFFCLRPGQPFVVRVYPFRDMNENEFCRQLLVRSIYDTYH